jgi:hypothetical protein
MLNMYIFLKVRYLSLTTHISSRKLSYIYACTCILIFRFLDSKWDHKSLWRNNKQMMELYCECRIFHEMHDCVATMFQVKCIAEFCVRN